MKESDLPKHGAELIITHNEFKSLYMSIEDWLNESELYYWKSQEDVLEAIDNNSIWTLQWYPNTPVGFNAVAAPTLAKLLLWAKEYEELIKNERV